MNYITKHIGALSGFAAVIVLLVNYSITADLQTSLSAMTGTFYLLCLLFFFESLRNNGDAVVGALCSCLSGALAVACALNALNGEHQLFWLSVVLSIMGAFVAMYCFNVFDKARSIFRYIFPVSLLWVGSAYQDAKALYAARVAAES